MTVPGSFGHRRGEQKSDEVFPDYAPYLDTETWPSIDNGRQLVDLSEVTSEGWPPQRAASSLAKLVRWARWEPKGQCAVLDDPDVREEYVRTTRLGLALAARALNMTESHMYGLYGETTAETGSAPVHEVVADLAVALGEDYPEWSMRERVSLALQVFSTLDKTYLVKKRRS